MTATVPADGTAGRLRSPAPGDVAGALGIRSSHQSERSDNDRRRADDPNAATPDRQIRTNRASAAPAGAIAVFVDGYLRNEGWNAECGGWGGPPLTSLANRQIAHPQAPTLSSRVFTPRFRGSVAHNVNVTSDPGWPVS
jgi:hypothetical protein